MGCGESDESVQAGFLVRGWGFGDGGLELWEEEEGCESDSESAVSEEDSASDFNSDDSVGSPGPSSTKNSYFHKSIIFSRGREA